MNFPQPRPEDEPYYRAIGRFIHEFSTLELVLKSEVVRFARLSPDDGSQIMTHDFAITCSVADRIVGRRLGDKSRQWSEFIKQCRQLNDHRVRIVHGYWLLGGETRALYHLSRSSLELQEHYGQHEQLAALVDDILKLYYDITTFLSTLPDSVRPKEYAT